MDRRFFVNSLLTGSVSAAATSSFSKELAAAGAGVSLSNGWMEHAGLSCLSPSTRERILKDWAELRTGRLSPIGA